MTTIHRRLLSMTNLSCVYLVECFKPLTTQLDSYFNPRHLLFSLGLSASGLA